MHVSKGSRDQIPCAPIFPFCYLFVFLQFSSRFFSSVQFERMCHLGPNPYSAQTHFSPAGRCAALPPRQPGMKSPWPHLLFSPIFASPRSSSAHVSCSVKSILQHNLVSRALVISVHKQQEVLGSNPREPQFFCPVSFFFNQSHPPTAAWAKSSWATATISDSARCYIFFPVCDFLVISSACIFSELP